MKALLFIIFLFACAPALAASGSVDVGSGLFLPNQASANGKFLTSNGVLASWADVPAAGADTALSNLVSVAINTILASDTDNTDDLGTDAKEWKDAWIYAIKHNSAGTPDLNLTVTGNNGSIKFTPNGVGNVIVAAPLIPDSNGGQSVGTIGTNFGVFYSTQFKTSGAAGTFGTTSGIGGPDTGGRDLTIGADLAGVNGAINGGALTIKTSNTASGGNSGALNIYTGSASGGTAGTLNLRAGNDTGNSIALALGTLDIYSTIAGSPWADGIVSYNSSEIGLWGTGNAAAVLKFYDTAQNHYSGFKAPAALTADKTFTLPNGDGSSGQVLSTNGSGVLSWASNVATATALAANPSDCSGGQFATTIAANGDLSCATAVTSVGATVPNILSVANSPITGSGTLAITLATQSANTIFAGPTTGVAAVPSFRALVAADIPSLSATYLATSVRTTPTSYSPTFPSNTGISSSSFLWYRDGKYVYIDGQILFSGAGPSAALTITLPNSYTIDTAFLPGGTATSNAGASGLGNGDSFWFQNAVAWKSIWPKFNDTTHIGFWNSTQAFFQDQQTASSGLNIHIRFPATELSQ